MASSPLKATCRCRCGTESIRRWTWNSASTAPQLSSYSLDASEESLRPTSPCQLDFTNLPQWHGSHTGTKEAVANGLAETPTFICRRGRGPAWSLYTCSRLFYTFPAKSTMEKRLDHTPGHKEQRIRQTSASAEISNQVAQEGRVGQHSFQGDHGSFGINTTFRQAQTTNEAATRYLVDKADV